MSVTGAERSLLVSVCTALVLAPEQWRGILSDARRGASAGLAGALDALALAYAGGAPMPALVVVQLYTEGAHEAASALWRAAGRCAA